MRPRRGRVSAGGPRAPRLLALRAHGLTGLCTAVPALRALRAAFPRHHVVLAAPGALRPVAALTEAVDEVLATEGVDAPLAWRGPSPDVAVNLHGPGPDSHALLQALWPSRTVAYSSPAVPGVEGPAWDPDEDDVARWCRLLRSFGIAADTSDDGLRPPDEPSPWPGCVLVHVGAAASGHDRWPRDRWAAVTRALDAAGHDVVVTGLDPAGVDPAGSDVPDPAGFAGHVVPPGTLGPGGLATVVAGAAAVATGPSGVAYLAAALDTPSVTLTGRRASARTGLPTGPRHVLLGEAVPSVATVRDAVVGLLAPPRSRSGGATLPAPAYERPAWPGRRGVRDAAPRGRGRR